MRVAAAIALFAVGQFSALIVAFFLFAAAAFAGDQRDPAAYWWAAAGCAVLASPGVALGFWWRARRNQDAAVAVTGTTPSRTSPHS